VSKVLISTKAKANEKEGEEGQLQLRGWLISRSQGGGNCKVTAQKGMKWQWFCQDRCSVQRETQRSVYDTRKGGMKERKMDERGSTRKAVEQEQC